MDLSLGMKYTNMIIVAILALRFLIKLRFPANTPISVNQGPCKKTDLVTATAVLILRKTFRNLLGHSPMPTWPSHFKFLAGQEVS